MSRLIQVTAPHFCAGIITEGHIVKEAAPILRWTIGKSENYLVEYFRKKRWHAKVVETY